MLKRMQAFLVSRFINRLTQICNRVPFSVGSATRAAFTSLSVEAIRGIIAPQAVLKPDYQDVVQDQTALPPG